MIGWSSNATYSPDAANAGRRALRNACLDLLAAGDSETGAEIAMRQFQSANNMTDQFAALATLSQLSAPQRERALDSFFRAHATDALVVDKWFSLQATIPEAETLERVRRLTKTPRLQFFDAQSRLCADRRLRQRQSRRLQRRRRRRL